MATETAQLGFLEKQKHLEKSQDYELLRAEGLEHIERLAHELWTDYNVHDPGVTLLELLCYAIADLGYRTGYDIRDILTESDRGAPVNRSNFHTARRIFTCNPVSFDDLRKLLIDVDGVRNAWIEPHCSVRYWLDRKEERLVGKPASPLPHVEENPPLGGLYDVFIEYEDRVQKEPRVYHTGILDRQAGDGGFVEPQGRGIRFHVAHELTLEAVSVIPETTGKLEVRILDNEGLPVAAPFEIDLERAGEKNRIPLGVRLPPGEDYRIETSGEAPDLYRTANPRFPYSIEDVIYLVSGAKGEQDQKPYLFFYDWEVSFAVVSTPAQPRPRSGAGRTLKAATKPRTTLVTRMDVHESVVDRLHRHRNLCEDFVNVCGLSTEEVALCADIEAAPEADLEELQAEIFYRLAVHVSPPVRFHTIQELLDRGKTTDAIFEGPALDHGFIDDEEFQRIQRRCEIRTSDVVRIVMEIPGVRAVKSIALLSFLDGKLRTQEDWVLALATDRFRAPEFSQKRSRIIFYRNELPYYANRTEVEARLNEKKGSELQTRLKRHVNDLPIPVGEDKRLSDYYPVQNELPLNYMVGPNRVPASETPLRKAQSRQLKAYLMFFEQLLANYLAQLSRVRELFSWEETTRRTYFTQEVTGIADLADVYDGARIAERFGTLAAALDAIAEDSETAEERRNRFLEHLVARFCESFTDYSLLMFSMLGESAPGKLNRDKREFLADYPDLSANRSQAYDYRSPENPDNLSGYQRRVYRLLGIEDLTRRHLAGHRLKIDSDAAGEWRFVLHGENGVLFESRSCESRDHIEALLDFAIEIGGTRDNYDGFDLVLQCPGKPKEVVGTMTSGSEEELVEVIAYFKEVHLSEGFHVIEQVLLRKRTEGDRFLPVQLGRECDCVEVRDPYSFRMIVVLPSWPERFRDLRFRRLVEDTLRLEAPAHVYPRVCWINHAQMKHFETVHDAWASALAGLAAEPVGCRAETGAAAETFRRGELPLAPTAPGDEAYKQKLEDLIDTLHSLVTVYPLARLHDCRETRGDTPQVTLNNTSLGTF